MESPTRHEAVEQDAAFRQVVAGSSVLAFAVMLGAFASFRLGGEGGFRFEWTWTIVPWTIAGALLGWRFWSLVWRAQLEPSRQARARVARFSILLFLVGLGGFLSPMRFIVSEKHYDLFQGLIRAAIFLAITFTIMFIAARAFESGEKPH